MPVVGIQFTSIEAKKKANMKPGGKINSVPKLTSAEEKELGGSFGSDKKALVIGFEFVTDYEPDSASIKLTGELLYMDDDIKKSLSEWKKNKALPEPAMIEVLNVLFRKCLAKVLVLAEDLQLPLPLPVPTVQPKAEESSGTGYIR